MLTAGILLKMYGNLGFVPTDAAHPLDMVTASSSPMTLKLMTIFAVIFLPIVLAYEAWSYWVFRRRLSTASIPETAH